MGGGPKVGQGHSVKGREAVGSSYLFTTCVAFWLATVLYSWSGGLMACLIFTVGALLLSEQLGPSLCRPLGAQEWPSVTICHRQPGREIQQDLDGWERFSAKRFSRGVHQCAVTGCSYRG